MKTTDALTDLGQAPRRSLFKPAHYHSLWSSTSGKRRPGRFRRGHLWGKKPSPRSPARWTWARASARNRDLVGSFVDSVSAEGAVDEQWQAFVAAKCEAELEAVIVEQKLKPEQTRACVEAAFRDGQIRTTGTEINRIPPSVSRFNREAGHGDLKRRIVEALTVFFDRFFGFS